jgi:hypothetical protein
LKAKIGKAWRKKTGLIRSSTHRECGAKVIRKNISGVVIFSAFVFASSAYAGRAELTAYYPIPYGEYSNLKSTKSSCFATDAGERVGIGTTAPNPNATLDVIGNIFDTGGSFIFSTAAGVFTAIGNAAGWAAIENSAVDNTLMIMGRSGGLGGLRSVSVWDRLDVNGVAYCTLGAWSGSDIRRKTNIAPLSGNTLDEISKLRGVKFDWKQEESKDIKFPKERQIGLIAQEVEKEFPELVSTDGLGYKAVAYDRFTAVLLEAVKAQQRDIESLKAELDQLKRSESK